VTKEKLYRVAIGAARRQGQQLGVTVGHDIGAIAERREQLGLRIGRVEVVEVAVKRLLIGAGGKVAQGNQKGRMLMSKPRSVKCFLNARSSE